MGAGTMILTIMIMLYVSSSLHMQFLSHAQTVTKEVHRMNTWHMTLPPYMDTTGSNSQQERQAYWKSFKYMIDIKINSSREIINDRLMRLLQGHTFPYSVNQNIKIANICLNTNQPVKLFKYAITIKINASSKAVIGRLRGLLHNQQFPVCIKKGMKISSANLTTVCLSNTNRTECRCENQYFWSTEQCAKHGVCDGFQNDTCGCISSPPTDGKSCQRHPAPPPKSFKYTLALKINASSKAVVGRLRGLLHGQQFPVCIKKSMEISSANLTTVCLSNTSRTECRCENRYFWSTEQCTKHGVCDGFQNDTCGCISSPPTDGTSCQLHPVPPLKSFKYALALKINASSKAVIGRLRGLLHNQQFPVCIKKGMKISSANLTTVCLSNTSRTECRCENQYFWSTEQCAKHGVCDDFQNDTCGCIASPPTDGKSCQRHPVPPLKSFKYTLALKINASSKAVIGRLRELLHGQQFPVCIKKGMKISSANLTTVCLSNTSRTECRCENQYFWSTEQCAKHGVCDGFQNDTCGCIASPPTDGKSCQPVSPLKSFKYTLALKINASSKAVIGRLRELLHGQQFPVCIKKGMKISSANLTTVCLSNTSRTECRCENQYFWSTEQCAKHGVCDGFQNDTCGCIASPPTDGKSCQRHPVSPLKSFKYTLALKINASSKAVIGRLRELLHGQQFPVCIKKGMKISSANLTTVCLSNTSRTECRCENQYFWSTEQCAKHGVCDDFQNDTCGCIASPPTDGKSCQRHHGCTPPTIIPSTTEIVTTKSSVPTFTPTEETTVNQQMSLALDEIFDANLNNLDSDKFRQYKSDIETAIEISYKNVFGMDFPVSVTVTGFRPGSVIVDFFITSFAEIQSYVKINQELITNLNEFKFNVDPNSIAETEQIDMHPKTAVFPEENMQLNCLAKNNLGRPEWRFKGNIIQQSTDTSANHYEFSADGLVLTVKNVGINNNGRYECLFNTSKGLHILWDKIEAIKPYPGMQIPSNKTYRCENKVVELSCCVHLYYSIEWQTENKMLSNKEDLKCISYNYIITTDLCGSTNTFICKLTNKNFDGFSYGSKAVQLKISSSVQQQPNSPVTCFNDVYGFGNVNQIASGDCDKDQIGRREGVCLSNGTWLTVKSDCVLRVIDDLKQQSQGLDAETLKDFVITLDNVTSANKDAIVQSPATVSTLVGILDTIAEVSTNVKLDENMLTGILQIVDVLSSDAAKPIWQGLNTEDTSQGSSSKLLNAIEHIIKAVSDQPINITSPTKSFIFKKITTSEKNFKDVLDLNSTAEILIPNITSTQANVSVTTVAFSSLRNVMPARDQNDNLNVTDNVINGLMVIVNTSRTINNIQLRFQKVNDSEKLANTQCVFWEFSLFNGTGGWDSTGCELIDDENDNVTCRCNHTTSFSILMSPAAPNDLALSVITYIGVSVSIASLVVCLIIEALIWKAITRNETSHMRHVSMVNVALSLLIADICFIIGAAVVKPGEDFTNPCSTVVFFTHFFYLALFFWMLISALLLLYRTMMVFSNMSKTKMMVIAFFVGYGGPLLISVITVAATAGSKTYITSNGACWLNWDQSKALLAFVVPALVIVAVNIVIVIVVVSKMLRRGIGERTTDERNVLKVIIRCVAILTPLFGITWGLGLGIMIEPKALAVHYLFAIFNSFQGFFVLVLGTLMEKKVRETLKARIRHIGSITQSSSAGSRSYNRNSSSGRTTLTDVISTLLRRGRNVGSHGQHSSSASESFLNS